MKFIRLGLNSSTILSTIGFGSSTDLPTKQENIYQTLYNVAVGNIILAVGGLIVSSTRLVRCVADRTEAWILFLHGIYRFMGSKTYPTDGVCTPYDHFCLYGLRLR